MNLFKIDFIQGKTDAEDYGEVVHSLQDTASARVVHTLTLSSDRLSSVSNYAREPKRLEFEVFNDSWITEYLLSGNYEHERYVSHYLVKCYRDTVLIFTGIIDTSNLLFTPADDTVKFLCYDYLKLLSLFADLNKFYSLAGGYTPAQILGYLLQAIETRLSIDLPYSSALFAVPDYSITAADFSEMIQLTQDDLSVMNTIIANGDGWVYNWFGDSYAAPKQGFITSELANTVTYIIAHRKEIQGVYDNGGGSYTYRYKARYFAKIVVFFSGICGYSNEYSNETDWQDSQILPNSDSDLQYRQFFTDNGLDEYVFDDLDEDAELNDTLYEYDYTDNLARSAFSGAVFSPYVHPGKYYETSQGDETANSLRVLQAILLMFRATLRTNAAGVILLQSLELSSPTPVTIAASDVVSISSQRLNSELPDTSVLDVLAGDTTVLQSLVKDYSTSFFAGRWQTTITVDRLSAYSIALNGIITINSASYYVVEVQNDFIADDYKIKAWLLS